MTTSAENSQRAQTFLRWNEAINVASKLRHLGYLRPVDHEGKWLLFNLATNRYATEADCAPHRALFTPGDNHE